MTTRDLFARHNLRCTTQRRALYETRCEQPDHPTAEELFRLVRPHIARLSLATVYNTLEALCREGLARRLPTGNGCCRYDADTSDHLHVRFRETVSVAAMRGVLSAYRNRFVSLRDAVMETQPEFREELLAEVPVADLLTESIAALAARWQTVEAPSGKALR